MGLPASPDEHLTGEILRSQFGPLRAKGAPTYFVPGNHDWDKSGVDGLLKIKSQGEFLKAQHDPGLRMIPPNGCPDPVAVDLGDSLVVIAYDSEWWLFPYDKANPDAGCLCQTKQDVLDRMEELKIKHRGKIILLASHHPLQSYGSHGGKFSLKDHIFPLTNVKKYLWIPLPFVGSLYPLLRSVFKSPEDIRHPLYQDMIRRIENVFDSTTVSVHVAGHEHGLQLIQSDHIQIVSGAGAKHSFAKRGRYSLFSDATQGFVTVDLLSGQNLEIRFFIYRKEAVILARVYRMDLSRHLRLLPQSK